MKKIREDFDHIFEVSQETAEDTFRFTAPKLNQGNYAIVRTDVVIGVRIQKKESETERFLFHRLCGKRTWSAEFGILEKIMGFFQKEKSRSEEKKEKE